MRDGSSSWFKIESTIKKFAGSCYVSGYFSPCGMTACVFRIFAPFAYSTRCVKAATRVTVMASHRDQKWLSKASNIFSAWRCVDNTPLSLARLTWYSYFWGENNGRHILRFSNTVSSSNEKFKKYDNFHCNVLRESAQECWEKKSSSTVPGLKFTLNRPISWPSHSSPLIDTNIRA